MNPYIALAKSAVENYIKGKRVLDKAKFKSLSYEGPFGVGYLVSYFAV